MRPAWVLVSLVLVADARIAGAQGRASNEAAAEALFNDGRALVEAGQVEAGCKKLEASQVLDPGTGTLIHLGDCLEKLGRTASAWARFREAASRAARDGRADWEGVAKARAAELEPMLARLRIDAPAGVTVRRDNEDIPAAALGTPLPIDPGDYALTAAAPGKKGWSGHVHVERSALAQIAVPPLDDDPSAAPAPNADDARASAGSPFRKIGFAIAGVGIVGLAVGSIAGLSAISLNNRSKKACPSDGVCADEGARKDSDGARSAATVSTIGFVAGGALLAGGVALVLASPSASSTPSTPPRASARARLRATPGAVWLEGAF